jgi:hypothetical protein
MCCASSAIAAACGSCHWTRRARAALALPAEVFGGDCVRSAGGEETLEHRGETVAIILAERLEEFEQGGAPRVEDLLQQHVAGRRDREAVPAAAAGARALDPAGVDESLDQAGGTRL